MTTVYVTLTIIGSILGLILAPLVDGIERKLRAKVQNRIGPPITQTWLDIVKLLRKESLIPRTAQDLFFIAPPLTLAMSAATLPLLCYGAPNVLGFYGDIIVILYLIAGSSILLYLGATASGNPYAAIGFSRRFSLLIACELLIALAVVAVALKTGSLSLTEIVMKSELAPSTILAGLSLLITSYVESSRLPFELAVAKPEIMGGILIEYSGRLLAFAELSHLLHRFVLVLLGVDITLAPALKYLIELGVTGVIASFILVITSTVIVLVIFGVIEALCGRTRLDYALQFTSKLIVLPIISIVLASIGV